MVEERNALTFETRWTQGPGLRSDDPDVAALLQWSRRSEARLLLIAMAETEFGAERVADLKPWYPRQWRALSLEYAALVEGLPSQFSVEGREGSTAAIVILAMQALTTWNTVAEAADNWARLADRFSNAYARILGGDDVRVLTEAVERDAHVSGVQIRILGVPIIEVRTFRRRVHQRRRVRGTEARTRPRRRG